MLRSARRFAAVPALILIGCGDRSSESPASRPIPTSPAKAVAEPWIVRYSGPAPATKALLWNGLVGARFNLDGSGIEAMSIHDYQPDGEEKIRSHRVSDDTGNAGPFDAQLDLKSGVITSKDAKGAIHTFSLKPGTNAIEVDGKPITLDGKPVVAGSGDWKDKWSCDITIDGPVEDQQAIRSMMFHLYTAIDPKGGMSISPYGLSSTTYNGHVFWDADTWVFPVLALIDPPSAKAIIDYRVARKQAAVENGFNELHYSQTKPIEALKYPWESSVTGKETVPGDSQKELHISGDVAWAAHQAESLGITPSAVATVSRVGAYYLLRATKQDPRELKDVMSPDEFHIGDNDLYTNLLAQWCANGGRWDGQYQFKLPKDDKSFLTYDHDGLRSYKQAAAVLAIYPLQFPPAEAQARLMMDRFADKITKNGPAMSDSIHATIWARLGETDRAYETWKRSWEPFLCPPFAQFSEKRNRPTTYFTTGAAGCLQTVLYGFLGFRLDSKQAAGATWSQRLPTGDWLSIKPNLPKAWKSIKFESFRVLGKRYTLIATHEGATITPTVLAPQTGANPKEK